MRNVGPDFLGKKKEKDSFPTRFWAPPFLIFMKNGEGWRFFWKKPSGKNFFCQPKKKKFTWALFFFKLKRVKKSSWGGKICPVGMVFLKKTNITPPTNKNPLFSLGKVWKNRMGFLVLNFCFLKNSPPEKLAKYKKKNEFNPEFIFTCPNQKNFFFPQRVWEINIFGGIAGVWGVLGALGEKKGLKSELGFSPRGRPP